MRLDIYMHEIMGIQSRNKASELIKNSFVLLNDKIVAKASAEVEDGDKVEIITDEIFVSRAAYKLMRFLKNIDLDLENATVLDIGSSTGGFAQILLNNGVEKIVCVDVGSNQLHQSLRNNQKIELFENMDIRNFKSNEKFPFCTCDVSFISVGKILGDIDRLCSDKIIILFKPQFEVGVNAKRDKNGVVTDANAIAKAKAEFFGECSKLGWKLILNLPSEISGKEGNIEEFYYFEK